MPDIRIPNEWAPTEHQRPLWNAMRPRNGTKRGIAVWHRRAGKDSVAINLCAVKAHQEVGTYWHLLPTNVQARRVVWNETDRHGRRIIEQAFPMAVRANTLETDMSIRLLNGSMYQLGGSDNYNSLVGANVRGVIFSEWPLCDPSAWNYIRPILVENGGWALFIYTPRGRNHGWTLWESTKGAAHWIRSKLDVTQTCREDGTPIMTEEQVDQEIRDGMSPEAAQQEFYCSFAAGVVGAYFARAVEEARDEGRITAVPHDHLRAVRLYFDIGVDDKTTCWFGQREGWMRKWIRYEEWRDTSLQDVFSEVATLCRANRYRVASVNLPHDGKTRDKGTLLRPQDYAEAAFEELGCDVFSHPAEDKQSQIEAGRHLLTQSWIDETLCARGLDALLNYSKIWDEKRGVYLLNPLHNWASDGADSWMLAAMLDEHEPVHEPVDMLNAPRGKPKVRRSIGMSR
jgi:hypothetical protein